MSEIPRGKDLTNNTKNDFKYLEMLDTYFTNSVGTNIEKIQKRIPISQKDFHQKNDCNLFVCLQQYIGHYLLNKEIANQNNRLTTIRSKYIFRFFGQ